jgi:hypothetical protein
MGGNLHRTRRDTASRPCRPTTRTPTRMRPLCGRCSAPTSGVAS